MTKSARIEVELLFDGWDEPITDVYVVLYEFDCDAFTDPSFLQNKQNIKGVFKGGKLVVNRGVNLEQS